MVISKQASLQMAKSCVMTVLILQQSCLHIPVPPSNGECLSCIGSVMLNQVVTIRSHTIVID